MDDKPRRRRTSPGCLLLLGIPALVCLGLVLIGGAVRSSAPPAVAAAPVRPAPVRPAPVAIGSELRNADWSVVVEKATRTTSYTAVEVTPTGGITHTATAGGHFIIIDLRVQQLVRSDKSLREADFLVYDDRGREYAPVPMAKFGSFYTFLLRFGRAPIYTSKMTDIEPLETGLLFDVHPDATGLILRVKPLNADVALT